MIKKFLLILIAASMIFALGACKPQAPVTSPDVTDIIQYYDSEGNLVTGDNQPVTTISPAAGKLVIDPINPGVIDPAYKIDKVYNTDVTIHVGWGASAADLSKDPIGRFIQNKFRCKFDLKIMPIEKILLLAAQDQLPDLFRIDDITSTIFAQLEDQKFLYHVKRTTVDQYPLLKHYYSIDDYLNAFSDNSYDKQFVGLPFLDSTATSGLGYDTSMFYRTDWAANVNYTVTIDTMEKAYQLMKKFREEDPDRNGFKDTYGFGGHLWSIEFIDWVDTHNWVKETDPNSDLYGLYVPGYVNSRMFGAIQYWNRMLKEQIMPADFNLQQIMAAFISDQAGVSYGNSGYYWRWEFFVNRFDPAHKDLYPTLPRINGKVQTVDDVVGEFEVLKLNDNSPPRHPAKIQTGMTAISAKAGVDTDKISRILDFFEWSMTQDGANFLNYGILGTDYKIDSSGKAVRLLPDSITTPGAAKKIWEVYPSIMIAQLIAYSGSTPIPERTTLYPQWVMDETDRVQVAKDKYAVVPTLAINNIMTPAKQRHLDAYQTLWWEDKLNRVIAQDGGKTIEQGWADFKTELLDTKEVRQAIIEVNDIMKTKGLVGQP